jgi:hypothetical protein
MQTRLILVKEDALNFLKSFRLQISHETKKGKTLQKERDVALERIEKFVNDQMCFSCKALPHINSYRYAIDLALRVRRPRIIDQSDTAFCGPVSIGRVLQNRPEGSNEFRV